MKKKKTKKSILGKRKIIIIITIAIVAFMITSSIISIFTPTGKANRIIRYINNEKPDKDVMPIGNTSSWYSQYKGTIDSSIIDKSVSYFSKTLIPEYKKIDNTEKYYKKHKKAIKILLGIEEAEEFKLLVNKIKTLNGDNLEFEKYFIVDNSSEIENNKLKTVIAIQYKDNEVILFTLRIANQITKKKTPVQYSSQIDKQYTVYRDDTKYDTESHADKSAGRVIEK